MLVKMKIEMNQLMDNGLRLMYLMMGFSVLVMITVFIMFVAGGWVHVIVILEIVEFLCIVG